MDGTKPPFRPLAFILIDEVPVLKGNLFAAVFDFKDLTGVFFLVIDDHVKLASLKLQFENTVILVGRLHGFQQHNTRQMCTGPVFLLMLYYKALFL